VVAEVWYRAGLRFECQRCGGCCRGQPGYVWVRDTEIITIARHLRLATEEFMERFVRRVLGDYSLIELANGDCIFWTPEGCRIYPVRPTQCRTFPFWREYVRTAKAWEDAARRCRGVNRGRLYSPSEIDRMVEDTDA
jgi:hypothetical protein